MPPILELKGITKRFPGVLANDHIDIKLEKGEILALLGENGAGKTTLMNILYGLYKPDEGEIFINGAKVEISSPIDAIRSGIGMVHQHFMLIPVFTVTENVMLGEEYTRPGGFLDRNKAADRIRELSETYKLNVNPDDLVENLPVGLQQRVEIIKLLFRNADILIMDEPTAVLTPQEVDELFNILKKLVEKGKSIIFITHKLREVMECADRIEVIRSGKVVGATTPAEASPEKLATMMVGREVDLITDKKPGDLRETVLTVDKLCVRDFHSHVVVDDVTFELHGGEILGIAGVQGNGQTELVRALTGLKTPFSGKIIISEKDVSRSSPRRITELGSAHIPEDRQKDGLILASSIAENLVLNTYFHRPFSNGIILERLAIDENANELVRKFDIRTPGIKTLVHSLSGGNQQKVIIAREFSRPIKLLIASQPTRGLDVGSIEYIHSRIIEKRDEGCAVLLVSTELDEIMQLSDRIAVMFRGKIITIVKANAVTKEELGLIMAGVTPTINKKKIENTQAREIIT
ncbi:MAG: heme ABC transporter ATP-binding protein [Chloroflexi bacterium GWB2_49_20]|nr:MAG: heme ABC transporter ATP-binding protein [Chloroflexi bacterium GWB2_49_20]OGN77194.1 MAG: heme ABC transporter ATP-binding protein [Chloroflexi bacterium GWC2_49_37]OGN83920.1 MAG: heme ABC transporter ATP-binding protein [Chloroflexi bacterium GWD2_49_16]